MTTWKNLTPHPIRIRRSDGSEIEIPPSGLVARVAVRQVVVGEVDGIPIVQNEYGPVEGLPDYVWAPPGEEQTRYIVSGLVLSRLNDRPDVFAPDTGPTAVRDERGQIVAVARLVAVSDD